MPSSEQQAAKRAWWREVVERQAGSGLSVRAFCRQESIREPSFYFWRRALREHDANPPAATPEFVPAVVGNIPQCDEAILLQLAAGQTLRLPVTISATWLAELILALDSPGER